MERSFSVDDLVGGLYRHGQAGKGRTDTEAAIQEVLKRIPSATNLAAAAGNPGGSAGADGGGGGLAASASFAAVTDAVGLGGGVPRVPSLDLLAKIVMQQAPQPAAAVKSEPPAPASRERARERKRRCLRARRAGGRGRRRVAGLQTCAI